MFWPEKPQFFGVIEQASNIGTGKGNYTIEMFKTDFPQFFNENGDSLAPETALEMFINRANQAVQPSKWLDAWRYASGLFVAHYLTLYLRTFSASSDTPQQAANTGALTGVVASASLGDAKVSYDTDALTKATEGWGSLNATQYGQILATEARLIGLGGSYVI